jgi:hypothetical protein
LDCAEEFVVVEGAEAVFGAEESLVVVREFGAACSDRLCDFPLVSAARGTACSVARALLGDALPVARNLRSFLETCWITGAAVAVVEVASELVETVMTVVFLEGLLGCAAAVVVVVVAAVDAEDGVEFGAEPDLPVCAVVVLEAAVVVDGFGVVLAALLAAGVAEGVVVEALLLVAGAVVVEAVVAMEEEAFVLARDPFGGFVVVERPSLVGTLAELFVAVMAVEAGAVEAGAVGAGAAGAGVLDGAGVVTGLGELAVGLVALGARLLWALVAGLDDTSVGAAVGAVACVVLGRASRLPEGLLSLACPLVAG